MIGNLYTLKDVAAKFQVTERTVHNWIANGKITPFRPGGRSLRFTEEEINRLMEEGGKAPDES